MARMTLEENQEVLLFKLKLVAHLLRHVTAKDLFWALDLHEKAALLFSKGVIIHFYCFLDAPCLVVRILSHFAETFARDVI